MKLGRATGEPAESQTVTPLDGGSAQRLALADVIGDGQRDLLAVVAVAGQTRLVVYPGTAEGTFGAEQTLVDPYAGDISVADVNGDGLPDLLSGSTIRLAESGGGYASPQIYYTGSGSAVKEEV